MEKYLTPSQDYAAFDHEDGSSSLLLLCDIDAEADSSVVSEAAISGGASARETPARFVSFDATGDLDEGPLDEEEEEEEEHDSLVKGGGPEMHLDMLTVSFRLRANEQKLLTPTISQID